MRGSTWSFGALGLLAGLGSACGGKAVLDSGAGGGGGSATTSSTTSNTTSPTTTTVDCDSLKQALDDAVAAAVACWPSDPQPQCTGTAYVYDTCQCQILANETNPQAIAAALEAFDAWVAPGCGPWDCGFCPVFGPGACVPSGNGGHCVLITPGG
ncbi:MAG: hypothetical protein IT373_25110 [Polyangiaceae bacterium]|nr:hypothetical protein [Polyangiaceae bacterium]